MNLSIWKDIISDQNRIRYDRHSPSPGLALHGGEVQHEVGVGHLGRGCALHGARGLGLTEPGLVPVTVTYLLIYMYNLHIYISRCLDI